MTSPDFPTVIGLEKSQDGSEYIYGGSVGLNRILGMFREEAPKPSRTVWPLYLVSAYTIMRNVFDKNLSDKAQYERFINDCVMFLTYMEPYVAGFNRHLHQPAAFVVYVPTYDALPEDVRRKKSPSDILLDEAYAKVIKQLPQTPTQTTLTPYSQRWVVPCGSRHAYAHKDLHTWLRRFAGSDHGTAYRYGAPALMMTHCLIDYHLALQYPGISLLESYTGHIRPTSEFGARLIPTGEVPFNVATHRVFGDSTHIQPIVQREARKKLIETAGAHRWNTKTLTTIVQEISTATGVASTELLRLKF